MIARVAKVAIRNCLRRTAASDDIKAAAAAGSQSSSAEVEQFAPTVSRIFNMLMGSGDDSKHWHRKLTHTQAVETHT